MNWRLEQKNIETDRSIQLANIYMVTGSIFFLAFISTLSIGKPEYWIYQFHPIAYVLYGTFPIGFLLLYQGFRYLGVIEFASGRYEPFIKKEKLAKFVNMLIPAGILIGAILLLQVPIALLVPSYWATIVLEIIVLTILLVFFGLETIVYLILLFLIDIFVKFIEESSKLRFESEGTLLDYLMVALAILLLLPVGALVGIVDWESWFNTNLVNQGMFFPNFGDPHWLAMSGLLFSVLIITIVGIESRTKRDLQQSA